VVEKDANGWWFVVNGEEQGWAPATFLERIEEAGMFVDGGMIFGETI
jgi:hypothetical protein